MPPRRSTRRNPNNEAPIPPPPPQPEPLQPLNPFNANMFQAAFTAVVAVAVSAINAPVPSGIGNRCTSLEPRRKPWTPSGMHLQGLHERQTPQLQWNWGCYGVETMDRKDGIHL